MGHVVLGWAILTEHVYKLEYILQVQKSMNISLGMVKEDENIMKNDMDDNQVTFDSLPCDPHNTLIKNSL